jgi:hypothetical protein
MSDQCGLYLTQNMGTSVIKFQCQLEVNHKGKHRTFNIYTYKLVEFNE